MNPESNLVYPNLSKCQLTLIFMFSLFVSGGFFEYVFQNPSITKKLFGKVYRDNHITIQHTLTSHCRSWCWCWCWCRGSWHCAKIEQKTFISIRIIYSKKHLIKLKGKIYPQRFSSYLLPLLCAGKALIKLHLKNNSNLKNHT